jgi:hypothetical protein
MANPNRGVWAARQRKLACAVQHHHQYFADAQVRASELRVSGAYARVTVKKAPRPLTGYLVRGYA